MPSVSMYTYSRAYLCHGSIFADYSPGRQLLTALEAVSGRANGVIEQVNPAQVHLPLIRDRLRDHCQGVDATEQALGKEPAGETAGVRPGATWTR